MIDGWMHSLTLAFFWFYRSGTHTHVMVLPLSFLFCCRHTHACDYMQTCLQSLKRAHTHTHTTPLAMYHGGLPCCLSNQRMGSFRLHWSEDIIPFPSSPMLNTQTHKYMTYIRMHTLAHSHARTHTHSPGEPPLPVASLKDWCDSSDKMRLCVITRYYTTDPPRNWISLECHSKHSLYTQLIVSQIMNRPL